WNNRDDFPIFSGTRYEGHIASSEALRLACKSCPFREPEEPVRHHCLPPAIVAQRQIRLLVVLLLIEIDLLLDLLFGQSFRPLVLWQSRQAWPSAETLAGETLETEALDWALAREQHRRRTREIATRISTSSRHPVSLKSYWRAFALHRPR